MKNAETLLNAIKEQDIQPKSPWYFWLRNTAFWGLFILFILFTSLSFSVVIYSFYETDLASLSFLMGNTWAFLLSLFPAFWIVFTGLFFIAAFFIMRKTKRGYRHSFLKLFLIGTFSGMIIGGLFFLSGGAQAFEQFITEHVSVIESVQAKQARIWQRPEKGYLMGTITEVQDHHILLMDVDGNAWAVLITDQTTIRARVELEVRTPIKIQGEMVSEDVFDAKEIRPSLLTEHADMIGNGGGNAPGREDSLRQQHLLEN